MSNTNMQDAILEAIDIIASQRMNFAKYDKTIQGVILQCVDATIGKYKVKYQDSIFIAYSENTSTSYPKGTSVYILVPNSDMTKAKTIIGAVNKLGVNFVQVYDLQEKYNLIGNNIASTSTNNWGLCSFKRNQLITLYDYEHPTNGTVRINTTSAQEYFKTSDLMILSMDVRTNLDPSQRYLGNYGLVIQADFKDQTAQQQQVTRYFVLDIDNFVGNPYLYTTETQQKAAFEIDGSNFIRIRSINLFSRDFPNYTTATKPDDIFISRLNIQGGRAFTTDELNTSALALITPRGYIFDQSDEATSYRTIEASVRIKGKKADINSQGVDFYWCVEDASITTLSTLYMKDAGQGWRCLNQYNVISDQLKEFIPGNNILTIKKEDVFTERVRYKCIAVYRDDKTIVLSKQIEIVNYDAQYKITIKSDLGTQFYKDNGNPTLTCECFYNNQKIVDTEAKYVWSMVSSVGVFESLSSQNTEVDSFTPASNTLQISVAKIVNFAVFKCSVFLPLNGSSTFIGTAAITIFNSAIDDNEYYLIINNGTQLFKYSTTGVSPASGQLDDPMQLKSLSFNLYDARGTEVDTKLIENAKVIWTVPVNNTMLDIVTSYQQPQEQVSTVTIEDNSQIVYKIKDSYSSKNTNNQIELEVNYNGKILKAKTDFTFLKEGESGTNGTDFVFKFVPDIQDGTRMPQYPTITFYSANNYIYNWLRKSEAIGKAQLWHNGELIYSSASVTGQSLEQKDFKITNCQTLKNNYGGETYRDKFIFQPSVSSYCSLNINAVQLLNSNTFLTTPFASILKATARYEGIDFISTMPICIGYLPSGNSSNKIFLKEGSGFNRVLYTSSGIKPMYDNRNPFEIEIVENGTTLTDADLIDFTFEWNCVGSVWNKIGLTWQEVSQNYLTIREKEGLKRNQVLIKPADEITGECVTTAVVCKVSKSDELFGFLYIPIHMYLNRYQNSAINGWDGNNIDLGDENGGMILAPQIGAGAKASNNRFTGVVMGIAKDPNESSDNNLGYDVGLFGYYQGRRSIFLDSMTGKAFFGVNGKGQIIIDPSSDAAILKSGNYNRSSTDGSGMQINLTAPEIRYGNGNFIVDRNGKLTATGAQIAGTLRIDKGGEIIAPSGGWNSDGLWLGGSTFDNGKFKVASETGSVTIRNGDIIMGSEENPIVQINKDDGLMMKRGSIRIGPDGEQPYVTLDATNGLEMKYGAIAIGSGEETSFKASRQGIEIYNGYIRMNKKKVTSSGSGGNSSGGDDEEDPIIIIDSLKPSLLSLKRNDNINNINNDDDDDVFFYDDIDPDIFNIDDDNNTSSGEEKYVYDIELDTKGLRIGYNSELSNEYNFEAKSTGELIVAKNFKLGQQTRTYLKPGSSGDIEDYDEITETYYAISLDSNNKVQLSLRGEKNRIDINGDGVLSFRDDQNSKVAKIEYKDVQIPYYTKGGVDEEGYEIPATLTKTVHCLNFSANLLGFSGGDVSVQKNLTAKNITASNTVGGKKISVSNGSYEYCNFSTKGAKIGISGSSNTYITKMYGSLAIREGNFSFYGNKNSNLCRVCDKTISNNENVYVEGFPVVSSELAYIQQKTSTHSHGNTTGIAINWKKDSTSIMTCPGITLKGLNIVSSITREGNTLVVKRNRLLIQDGTITFIQTGNDEYTQRIPVN